MLIEIARTTLEQADIYFENAREEAARPEEDVIPYSVCRHAYKAVSHYLTGYLQHHGKHITTTLSLNELLEECRKVNAQFNDLDCTLMNTKDPEEWMNMDVMKQYYHLAKQTRQIVTGASHA